MTLTLPLCIWADWRRKSSTLPSCLKDESECAVSLRNKEGTLTGNEGDQPGDIDVGCSCIGVEGGSAQVPLACVAVEALTLEETGDGRNVGGRGCHCPLVWGDADGAVGGGQQEMEVGGYGVIR